MPHLSFVMSIERVLLVFCLLDLVIALLSLICNGPELGIQLWH
jgi:hypothetical protein